MYDNVTIRPARPADVAELAALATQLGYPSTVAEVAARLPHLLDDPEQLVAVAVGADDCAVASVHVVVRRQLESDAWVEVAALVVDDQARGAGAGKALLAHTEAWAAARGYGLVQLRSNVIRERAHRFYLREGYEKVKAQVLFRRRVG
jgi:GNAT superfamily N-acetyltransferase